MKAMILKGICDLSLENRPLSPAILPIPQPGPGELLLQVLCCGICHTELDEIEGRTPPPCFPMVLGHQVVGRVKALGEGVRGFRPGDRVGVAWIFSSCGLCRFCKEGNDNLCDDFMATGRDVYGGYAEYMTVPQNSVFVIPQVFSDAQAAPLLCAGAIGYRSMKLTGLKNGQTLGLTGFGASAHLVMKMVRFKYPDTRVYVFARNEKEREFARELGATWAGDTHEQSPEKLHAIIDTTPVWKPIVEGLKNLEKGGRLVINAIRKESLDRDYLLNLDYTDHLWWEKEIKSVANVARSDVAEFLELASQIPIIPEIELFDLDEANRALMEIKDRKIRGAKVLQVSKT